MTAGLRCALLTGALTKTPTKTAIAHPKLMTIQPLPLPLVPLSRTLATTPSPNRISSIVPTSSAKKADVVMGIRFGCHGR